MGVGAVRSLVYRAFDWLVLPEMGPTRDELLGAGARPVHDLDLETVGIVEDERVVAAAWPAADGGNAVR